MANKYEEIENKRKHLELIQNTISRMGSNLFYMRGWSVTLATGLLAIFTSQKDIQHLELFPLYILGIITLMFWVYDGYFLAMERRYRRLYDTVRETESIKIDFSMDASKFAKEARCTVIYSMFSKTLWPFYSFLLIATGYLIVTNLV